MQWSLNPFNVFVEQTLCGYSASRVFEVSILFTFQNQSGCTMELAAALEGWRSSMMVSGGKCATINGAMK